MGDNAGMALTAALDVFPLSAENARLIAAAPLLLECLRDLVEAFPEGDDGMAIAGEFGADAWLSASRILLHQIDNDML